ncbi:MAG TPA: hypothetical protein DC058_19225 [Planctomycetaceae bacterium]|nr:hypothetical protein [Planctomycetaceae bacterium]
MEMVSVIERRGFPTEYRICEDYGEHRDCSPSGNHKRIQIGTEENSAVTSGIRGNSRRRPAMIAGSGVVLNHEWTRMVFQQRMNTVFYECWVVLP